MLYVLLFFILVNVCFLFLLIFYLKEFLFCFLIRFNNMVLLIFFLFLFIIIRGILDMFCFVFLNIGRYINIMININNDIN